MDYTVDEILESAVEFPRAIKVTAHDDQKQSLKYIYKEMIKNAASLLIHNKEEGKNA